MLSVVFRVQHYTQWLAVRHWKLSCSKLSHILTAVILSCKTRFLLSRIQMTEDSLPETRRSKTRLPVSNIIQIPEKPSSSFFLLATHMVDLCRKSGCPYFPTFSPHTAAIKIKLARRKTPKQKTNPTTRLTIHRSRIF